MLWGVNEKRKACACRRVVCAFFHTCTWAVVGSHSVLSLPSFEMKNLKSFKTALLIEKAVVLHCIALH